MRVGLNPYGLTWTLGLQGRGTPRANPEGAGLEGFLAIARELGAKVVEIFDPWLQEMSDDAIRRLRDRLAELDMVPVASAGLDMMGPMEAAFRSARLLDAKVIRLGLSPVLCGDRAAHPDWPGLLQTITAALAEWGPRAADEGRKLGIENHQDFGSAELVGFCAAQPGVGITFDMGNTFPVAEAPLDFARAIAPHVVHLHLKDYRVQLSPEGFRLVRCAIGDGCVPHAEMIRLIHAAGATPDAVLEPAALEARHVRLLTPGWWRGYPAKDARGLAACLAAAQVNRLHEDDDVLTPWERGEDAALGAYEMAMIRRSAENMRTAGIWDERAITRDSVG
ncbi:sugar phosphate isomerase/epimerase [Amaricoccus sp.]|uniref:sugar phosphate isomerase/epimerase family protein n=1 Tax=Amaricoccus sp. TaxID=1872485 RepID=UPI001B3D53C8|nr:sugar phosphate isomerase/epimerase family protein [Amaricoccus sp.]MBP7000884.1 sugar phosphate isomerase/epimerase [Amaricoccus sp.]